MSESKPTPVTPPTLTTKNTMNPQVRTVSQPSVEELKDALATEQPESKLMSTATEDEIKLLEQIGDNFMSDSIVARSLILPSYLDVLSKDPSVAFRWVNFKGGEGRQLFYARSFGFVNATPEDIASELDKSMVKDQDGGLVCGDLVLMKVNKLKLFQKYKMNVLRANAMAGSQNAHTEAMDKAQTEFKADLGSNAANYAKGRVAFFKPDKIPGAL